MQRCFADCGAAAPSLINRYPMTDQVPQLLATASDVGIAICGGGGEGEAAGEGGALPIAVGCVSCARVLGGSSPAARRQLRSAAELLEELGRAVLALRGGE